MLIILIIGAIPFLGLDTKITWTVYFGIPLIILTGSVGAAFITKRIEAIIAGVILSAFWPVFIDLLKAT
jgi:hypothetical protein